VSNTKPNETEDDEGEDSKGLANNDWIKLLNENDGVYSLKPWEEVMDMKANKVNVGLACREIMRQAWSVIWNSNNLFYYLTWLSRTVRQR